MLVNDYNMDNVKKLLQIYKNNISVHSSFQSFVVSFRLIQSPKYTMVLFMICSRGLYYNRSVLESFGHELRSNMNYKRIENCTSSVTFFEYSIIL